MALPKDAPAVKAKEGELLPKIEFGASFFAGLIGGIVLAVFAPKVAAKLKGE